MNAVQNIGDIRMPETLSLVLIDLTPLRPGGENGGAKPLTMELIRAFARLSPRTNFILLTAACAHEELAALDATNVRRLCVSKRQDGRHPLAAEVESSAWRWKARAVRLLPEKVHHYLRVPLETVLPALQRRRVTLDGRPDLLFCPFTAPVFHRPPVPTVSVVHDLQFTDYPGFFPLHEQWVRNRHFRRVRSLGRMIICHSGYVRSRIQALDPAAPEIVVIPPAIHARLPQLTSGRSAECLDRLGLSGASFLLYPANFWPHKNHENLLHAFALFRQRRPGAPLRLVLTGEAGGRGGVIRNLIQELSLTGAVLLPGFVEDEVLSALMQNCMALIFPSLYEGYGMPVIEAMHYARPVLCSNRTSLPEVAGGAALEFDPGSPEAIADAIEALWSQPSLAADLARRSRERAAAAPALEEMARRYLEAFQRAAGCATSEPALTAPPVRGR